MFRVLEYLKTDLKEKKWLKFINELFMKDWIRLDSKWFDSVTVGSVNCIS